MWRECDGSCASGPRCRGCGGIDHVGLGSDFDGAVKTPFDTTGLPVLFDALLKQGFGEEDLAKIAGGNALRVLREALP